MVLSIVLIIILQESELTHSLPIGKILAFHNVKILIKSFVNKNKYHYCYNIFLEKGSNKDKSNTQYF